MGRSLCFSLSFLSFSGLRVIMKIEDRMSMWAAKRPRDEVAELLLEGAQEIADLRRHREEDGEQMSALIAGYQKMQGLCIDGKYLTDDEKQAIEYYIGTGGPYSVDCTLIALLDRMRSGALTTCETVSQNGDCPASENVAEQDNNERLAALQALTDIDEELGLPRRTPATHATPSEGIEQNGCALTDAEREAIEGAIAACWSGSSDRITRRISGEHRRTNMTQEHDEPSGASGGSLAWIPVRDRLPNESRVLIFCPLLEPDETVAATRYKSGLWICDDGQMLGAGEPTHWMPLPAPPTDAK